MTATLARRAHVGGLGRAFPPVALLTATIAAVGVVLPEPSTAVQAVLVVAVVGALGIPHGAIDDLAAAAVAGHGARPDAGFRRRFARNYLLAMAGVLAVWLVAPAIALAAFLVLSIHHFGQSDLAALRLPRQLALQWSRGLFLVGLPLAAHAESVAPVIERLGGGDPARWGWLVDHPAPWSVLLVGQHVALGVILGREIDDRSVRRREAVTVAVLTAVFLATPPLVGFAVYFGLWHSLAHLRVLAGVLGVSSHGALARLVAPLTLVSVAGLALLVGVAVTLGRSEVVVPLVFVVVSMVTVPHMVVVERLWRAG